MSPKVSFFAAGSSSNSLENSGCFGFPRFLSLSPLIVESTGLLLDSFVPVPCLETLGFVLTWAVRSLMCFPCPSSKSPSSSGYTCHMGSGLGPSGSCWIMGTLWSRLRSIVLDIPCRHFPALTSGVFILRPMPHPSLILLLGAWLMSARFEFDLVLVRNLWV